MFSFLSSLVPQRVSSAYSSARESLSLFITEYRRPLLAVGGVAASAGLYQLYRRYGPLLADLKREYQLMRKLLRDFELKHRANRRQWTCERFIYAAKVSDIAVGAMMSEMKKKLKTTLDVEELLNKIKRISHATAGAAASTGAVMAATASHSSMRTSEELQLWDHLRSTTVTRTITALIDVAVLHALVKVQTAITARYALYDDANAIDSRSNAAPTPAATPASPPTPSADFIAAPARPFVDSAIPCPVSLNSLCLPADYRALVERAYSRFCTFALSEGLVNLISSIHSIVRQELMKFPLECTLSFSEICSLTQNIRKRSEAEATLMNAPPFINSLWPAEEYIIRAIEAEPFQLPSSTNNPETPQLLGHSTNATSAAELTALCRARLREMVAETAILFSSAGFRAAMDQSLDLLFSVLRAELLSYYHSKFKSTKAPASTFTIDDHFRLPLILIVSHFTKLFHSLLPDDANRVRDSPIAAILSAPFAFEQAAKLEAELAAQSSSSFSSSSSSASSNSNVSPVDVNLMHELTSVIIFPLSEYDTYRKLAQKIFNDRGLKIEQSEEQHFRSRLSGGRPSEPEERTVNVVNNINAANMPRVL